MASIFICYRREDSSANAGRLFDHLVQHFGADQISMDVDAIQPGENFVERLEEMVGVCDAMLVVIGRHWLSGAGPSGVSRLADPNDYVRLEIRTGLRRNIRIIPVLVSGATMPYARDLPADLEPLSLRQAVEIRDASFSESLVPLIKGLQKVVAASYSPVQRFVQQDSRIVERPVNLDFDGPVEGAFPHGWFDSSGFVAGVSPDYEVRVVRRGDAAGRCLMLQARTTEPGEFGSVMQCFPADFLAGRTVKLEGELRTEGVTDWAGLWLRADGKDAANVFFDNMSGQELSGTTGWKTYSIEGRLPVSTAWLNIGIVLSGGGTVWADHLRLTIWNGNSWLDV